MMRTRGRMLTMSALAIVSGLVLGMSARAAEPIQVGGRMTCTTPEQHAIPVDGDPGHVLVVQKVSCIGSASGQSARFDGGQQTWVEADDLVKGSGLAHGYELAKYKDGSTGVTIYTGAQVSTIVNGKPEWTALGTWEQIRGTGSLANVQLRGTWTAKPISEKEFVMDWEGTLVDGSGK
jgi:hypothetical protein